MTGVADGWPSPTLVVGTEPGLQAGLHYLPYPSGEPQHRNADSMRNIARPWHTAQTMLLFLPELLVGQTGAGLRTEK